MESNLVATRAESNWTYAEACRVIDQLRAIGIEAGVTVGGIVILFDLEKHGGAVVQIVKSAGGVFCTETLMMAITRESAERRHRENLVAKLEQLWERADGE